MFVSFCKPKVLWLSVLAIGTYLLWVLQGGFFTRKILSTTNDHKLIFYSRSFVYLSSPKYTSDVEGQLRKHYGKINPVRFIMKTLLALTLLHQKGALSYETRYGIEDTILADRVPPDKPSQNTFNHFLNFKCIALNNTYDNGEVVRFDSDSVSLYIDSCVTGGLTGFMKDFVEGSCVEIEERSSNTTTGTTSIISQGIAAYTLKDNDGEPHILYTKMAYAPNSKYRLMSP